MKKIVILSNFEKNNCPEFTTELIIWLKEQGTEVITPEGKYDVTNPKFVKPFLQKLAGKCDCILVLGGDGTLLSVARCAAFFKIPLLGINLGRIGFLAELEPSEDLYPTLQRLLDDDYIIEDRMMLCLKLYRDGKLFGEYHCLNDGVIQRGAFSGLVNISLDIDSKESSTFHGDGIIISTPTGASGYSLSAGGPLVAPTLDAIIVTPLCAQSLYERTIVLDAGRHLSVRSYAVEGEWFLTVDGKTDTIFLDHGDVIEIDKSYMTTQLIRLNGKSFYDVLNDKLKGR